MRTLLINWEQRKLSSGLREYTDRVIVEDDKEYYQISVRNNFGGITLRGSKMGNKIGRKRQAKINLTKYPQTLIFTRQTIEQGGIGWVDKYCDGAIVTENMPTISLDTSVFSKYFLTNLFQTRIFYKNAILDNVEGGSAQIAIHESKFLSSTLLFPNLDEQKKIGAFFKQLDDTIALQQRRLDLLKKLKQGYLQQMFPTKDEVIPQLRFNIFNGAWEQVKLSELVTKEKSYSLSRDVETEKETETRYIHYGDIHTGIADKITNKNQLPFIKEDSYESLLKGDLILADASEDYQGIAKPAIILETSKYRIVAGLHTIVLRSSDKSDSLYLYYLLKTKSFKRHGYRMGTGMKVFGITANNVLAFKTLLPSKKEQYRISQLLKIMDRLLALQQSKIKQLQQLKQAYLQKLFP
ncbi:restriction endonuclease subunit S [Latilactobacillus curvatus]|uniref:restriction endonuclease subunit S n=1 Tax=Latilactobacillus curvatus TaxID=28038 RepID=UPI0010AE3198|nr:restriction endonuclease subunit S [Latilactobacillus curvatus]TJY24514.1 restriction endonuclease subunit S [Latilactobacillus curvatus]